MCPIKDIRDSQIKYFTFPQKHNNIVGIHWNRLFYMKAYVVGNHYKRLCDTLLMGTITRFRGD